MSAGQAFLLSGCLLVRLSYYQDVCLLGFPVVRMSAGQAFLLSGCLPVRLSCCQDVGWSRS
jgi:hypothetical protein